MRQGARARLARLAWLLDSSIPIPGTPFTVGLEALIGLLPVAGDLVGVLLSGYIIREAAALGASSSILARMALNVALEGIIGMVPLAGDVFDAAFKANQRNVRLLNAYLDQPARTARASRGFLLGLGLALLGLVFAILALGVLLLRWVWSWF
jgi:hypothetical protein